MPAFTAERPQVRSAVRHAGRAGPHAPVPSRAPRTPEPRALTRGAGVDAPLARALAAAVERRAACQPATAPPVAGTTGAAPVLQRLMTVEQFRKASWVVGRRSPTLMRIDELLAEYEGIEAVLGAPDPSQGDTELTRRRAELLSALLALTEAWLPKHRGETSSARRHAVFDLANEVRGEQLLSTALTPGARRLIGGGRRATQAASKPPTRSDPQAAPERDLLGESDPRAQHVMTLEDFQAATYVRGAVRGDTLGRLDRLLGRYHRMASDLAGYQTHGRHMVSSAQTHAFELERRRESIQQILFDIEQVAQLWLTRHEADTTSRTRRRRTAVATLRAAAHHERDTGAVRKLVPTFDPKLRQSLLEKQGAASTKLAWIGKALGVAASLPGDSAQAEVEVRIPCEPSGVSYVGFRLKLSARVMDGTATRVGCEIAVTGGFKVPGLTEARAEGGLFVEAQGKTVEEAMQLISYGWYRNLRESSYFPRDMVSFMWTGSTGVMGWRNAERWAGKVERAAFSSTPSDPVLASGPRPPTTLYEYVRTGQLAGIHASAGVRGVGSMSGDLRGRRGTHFDRGSVTGAKEALGQGLGESLHMPAPGVTRRLGTRFRTVAGTYRVVGGPTVPGTEELRPFTGEATVFAALSPRRRPTYVSASGTFKGKVRVSAVALEASKLVFEAGQHAYRRLLVEQEEGLEELERICRELGSAQTAKLVATRLSMATAVDAFHGVKPGPRTPIDVTVSIAIGRRVGGRGWTVEVVLGQESAFATPDAAPVILRGKLGARLLRLLYSSDPDQLGDRGGEPKWTVTT